MGFSSFDDLLNQVTNNGKVYSQMFFKRGVTPQGAAVWQRTWNLAGIPGAGSEPAAGSGTPGAGGTSYVNADGSINLPAQSPATKHLLTWGAFTHEISTSSTTGRVAFALEDRLVGVGAISITTTGAKNVNTVALPRYTTGEGLDVWLEVTTSITGTPQVHLSSYTNSAATAGRSGAVYTLPTNPIAGTIFQLPLADGDLGLRSIEQLTVDTAGTAGVVNVIITKQLGAAIFTAPYALALRAGIMQIESIPQVFDGASLSLRYMPTSTTQLDIYGGAVIAYGG